MEPDNLDKEQPQQPTIDERQQYIEGVKAGKIKPTPEDLKGFTPQTSITGGPFTGKRAVQAKEAAEAAAAAKADESKGPVTLALQSVGIVDRPGREQADIRQAGIKAATETQEQDLELAAASLIDTISKDPMFFRGMKVHRKITSGEKAFAVDKDGLLTDAGKMDFADYEYFYNHPKRNISFMHGASQMLVQLGADISDTFEHLVGDATPVVNPEYKDKPNFKEIELEARNFVMLAVQNRISVDELNSGKVDEDRTIKFASLTGQDIKEARKNRQMIITTFRRYVNPEPIVIDGKQVKPKPLFVDPGMWMSAGNKTAGVLEAGVRVMKGYWDLAYDPSKDPLSVHGQAQDTAVISGLMQATSAAPGAPGGGHPGGYQPPVPDEVKARLLRLAGDPRSVTAGRINRAAESIAHLNKWASGETMIVGDNGIVPTGPVKPDPNVWSPGQTWADPLAIYGLGSGIFRAMRSAARAEASVAARYAAIEAAAAPERFSLELANVTRLFSGMSGLYEEVGRAQAAALGLDASKMTADDLANLGIRKMAESPWEVLSQINITPQFVDDFLNAIPKPEAVALTAEEWQLLPGVEKLKNLPVPESFATVENGVDVWKQMNPQQRMRVLIAERTSEIYGLARKRQAAGIVEATRAGNEAAQATADANSNASVARRTAGTVTSAFGEWVMGGRTLGNGFWRDLSVAGVLYSSAELIENIIVGGAGKLFGAASAEGATDWIKEQFRARSLYRTPYALGAFLGVNAVGMNSDKDSWVQYPRMLVNGVFLITNLRTLGYNAKNIGDFFRVWGDEIARGDPTLHGGYAAKIAANPESYLGIDPDLVMGPAGIAKFMSMGPEALLRLTKKSLYDFGLKGGGVAELMVYGKDRESLGQGFAIGTVFSGVGYSMVWGANKATGKSALNAMRSDSVFRMLHVAEGDPSNVLNFIAAHREAMKGGYESDFLGAFLGIDNSTRGKVRFIDDKMAATLRFAYDMGLKDQSESIRRSISLGYKTPEDIIGDSIRLKEIGQEVTNVTNSLNQRAAELETSVANNKDIAKQLTEKLKDPRLSKEERIDIATQKKVVQDLIAKDVKEIQNIKQQFKISDPILFLKNNGVDINTINARVRAGVNEATGNPVLTFRGLTIETTKDGPIVYINRNKMNSQALWHEAAEAVLLAGSVDGVVNSSVSMMWGNVGKNPQALKSNRQKLEEALKNKQDVNTIEFLATLDGMEGFFGYDKTVGGSFQASTVDAILDAHMKSAGLDNGWKISAIASIREYLTTGNMEAVKPLSREIMANYAGLFLEDSPSLRLYNNGDFRMTMQELGDKIFRSMFNDSRMYLEPVARNGTERENIRAFFVDPSSGKRIVIPAFERLSREMVRRANKFGVDKMGKVLLDLKKMEPMERKAWAHANNADHWLDKDGNLRDPKEITRIEAEMSTQSINDLNSFRDNNPTLIRSGKKVTTNKDGSSTTTIEGVFTPMEINALLSNPNLPVNIKETLVAYQKAMYRADGRIGLMQGMYSGESKETVYTPDSNPKLREWGSPLLAPEHRSFLPQSLRISYEKDANGIINASRVTVNGLDWKAIEQRVIIAAGSDLAVAHNLTISDLYGYMMDYATNLNKGSNNQDPKNNAIPSAKLFDPNGNNPTRGENIRDLMHFIFDFQKKKNDAYINMPAEWGELALRGPTHPYTSFRADRWTGVETTEEGRFIRINEAAYRLSQGNFMGDEASTPRRKLRKKDVSETTPEKEKEAVQAAIGPGVDVPPPVEKGKYIDVLEQLPPNRDDIFGRINDIYAYDGETIPKLVTQWFEETEGALSQRPPRNIKDYVDQLVSLVESKAKQGGGGAYRKNAQDRAQYVLPKLKELQSKVWKHEKAKSAETEARNAEIAAAESEAAKAAGNAAGANEIPLNIERQGAAARNMPMPVTRDVSMRLGAAHDQIMNWKEHYDAGDVTTDSPAMDEFARSERPFYVQNMRKALDVAFSLKPDFDPGFDIAKYIPDYKKPAVREDIQRQMEAEAAERRRVERESIPTAEKNKELVGQFKESAQDILSKIRVIRKAGEKEAPLDVRTYFVGSTKVGVGIEKLINVLEGNKGTIDYTYSKGVAISYSKGLEALIVENNKKLVVAEKKGDKAEIEWRKQYGDNITQLKSVVDGIVEYTEGIENTAPAKQKPAPGPGQAAGIAVTDVEIPYKTKKFISVGNVQDVSGVAPMISFGDRIMIVKNINGVNVPFYLSTGSGGKTEVAAGKWYPFFGVGPDGWLNKLGQAEINAYYGSDVLRQVAQQLDSSVGDIRGKSENIPKVGMEGLKFINEGLNPTENGKVITRPAIESSIKYLLERINSGGKELPIERVFENTFIRRTDKEATKDRFYLRDYSGMVIKNPDGSLTLYKDAQKPEKLWTYSSVEELMGDYKRRLNIGTSAEVNTPRPATAAAEAKPAPSAPTVDIEARKVYEHGAVVTNKNAPWIEGIPSKIEDPLGKAVLKLADEVINVEGAGLTKKQTTYFYEKFKAAKDAGVTAEQFWTMYDLDSAGAREIIGYINEYAKSVDGEPLFPYVGKKARPNLLAPPDVAAKAIERKANAGSKPKPKAAEAAEIPPELAPKEKPVTIKYDIEAEKAELTRLLDSMKFGEGEEYNKTQISRARPVINNLIAAGMEPYQIRAFINQHTNGNLLMKYTYPETEPAPTGKPKGTPTQEIPPELAPKDQPTPTTTPKWDAKKANKISSDIADAIEKWEDAYGEDGDTSRYEDKIYDLVDKLESMGLKRKEIEALLDGNDTSDGTIGQLLDDKFGPAGEEPEPVKPVSSGGQRPPTKPKPTAEAADSGEEPKKPRPKDIVIPDAPLIEDHPTDFGNDNDPKKNVGQLKAKYGPKVRAEVDRLFDQALKGATESYSKARDALKQLGKNATTAEILRAHTDLELVKRDLEALEDSNIEGWGIAFFDNSPAVRGRFFELYDNAVGEWFSKSQKTAYKKMQADVESYRSQLIKIAEQRVFTDMIGMLDVTTVEAVGNKSRKLVIAGKTPWIMADERTLLPIEARLQDFHVAERFIPADPKSGMPGTTGLIFIDMKAQAPDGTPAHRVIMNQIMPERLFATGSNGFMDVQVLNANGEKQVFRISSQGTKGMDAAELQKRYLAALEKQKKNTIPGEPKPALQFDVKGGSYSANENGLRLMNSDIANFLAEGQAKKNLAEKREGARQEIERKKKERQQRAEAQEQARKAEEEKKAKEATLRLGLYNRQPLDPNNPNTAMNIVENDRKIVSRRADSVVEIHKGKGKDGDFFKVQYLGQEFGGPRSVLKTASLEAAMNLAQAFTPFEGYRTAILSMIDGYPISEAGPWMDKDFKPTTDPKLAAPLSVIFEKYEKQFADALTRIRASGTYGLVDAGNGEYIVVPKKSIRDKDGNLDLKNPIARISKRLVLKAVDLANMSEAEKAQRQQANAQLPLPRPQTPAGPQAQATGGPAPLDIAAFTKERATTILQSARADMNAAKADQVTAVTKILTNRDNYKLMFMKDGTIRIYAANNNLLSVTRDEDEAFEWLLR